MGLLEVIISASDYKLDRTTYRDLIHNLLRSSWQGSTVNDPVSCTVGRGRSIEIVDHFSIELVGSLTLGAALTTSTSTTTSTTT